jgi:hypothetical protein
MTAVNRRPLPDLVIAPPHPECAEWVQRGSSAAEHRLHAERLEEVGGDPESGHALGFLSAGEIHFPPVERGALFEDVGLLLRAADGRQGRSGLGVPSYLTRRTVATPMTSMLSERDSTGAT